MPQESTSIKPIVDPIKRMLAEMKAIPQATVSAPAQATVPALEDLIRRMETARVPRRFRAAVLSDFDEPTRDRVRGVGSVLIDGPNGVGKSHMAAAILRERIANGGTMFTPEWWSAPEILQRLRLSFSDRAGENEREITRSLTSVPLLVIDDLGAEKTTDWSVSVLSLIVKKRDEDMRDTILTTNLTLKQIAELDPRIASRVGGFDRIPMAGNDRRLKR